MHSTISFAVALLLATNAFAVDDKPVDTVTVDLLVNGSYDDSDASIQQLQAFLKLRLNEIVVANSVEAVEQYMFNRYEFGPTALPRTFETIRAYVRDVNRDRADPLVWRIPFLPRLRRPDRNPDNPFYELPRVAFLNLVSSAPSGRDVRQSAKTQEDSRRGSKYTVLRLTMPRDAYERSAQEFRSSPFFRGLSRQFTAVRVPRDQRIQPNVEPRQRLAEAKSDRATGSGAMSRTEWDGLRRADSARASASVPASVDKVRAEIARTSPWPDAPMRASLDLRARLTTRHLRPTYLVVIDEGWPGAEEFQSSYAFFARQINATRTAMGLNPVALPNPATPTAARHVSEIRDSLSELTIDDPGAVKVIYIPGVLNDATEQLCKQLFIVGDLLKWRPQAPLRDTPPMTPMLGAAETYAVGEISAWKEARKATNEVDRFHTDGALLTCIYRLMDEVASREETAFFVNNSWTVRGDSLELTTTPRSFTVAATGNDGLDVMTSHIDFAQRAANDSRFVAVMYVDDSGAPTCGSGKVTEATASEFYAVAFNGRLADGTCGTSFAAPRVAWLLAARTAIAQENFDVKWQSRLQTVISKARRGGKPWIGIYLDPGKIW